MSAGVSVRDALVKNIHVISSMLVHVMLGVFFVVHTQPPATGYRVEEHAVVAAAGSKNSESSDQDLRKQQTGLSNAFMAIQPPQRNSDVTAKMSLARSLSDDAPHRGKALEGMLQSISFERQTSAVVRHHASKRDHVTATTGTSTVSEGIPEQVLESITNRFAECWTIPYDTQHPANAVVKINLGLDPHGQVTTASIADTYLYDHNPFYRAVADSALRAVYKCSPLSSLQAADYSLWNEIVLTFDTKHMSMS